MIDDKQALNKRKEHRRQYLDLHNRVKEIRSGLWLTRIPDTSSHPTQSSDAWASAAWKSS
jgi:hypothetical protein